MLLEKFNRSKKFLKILGTIPEEKKELFIAILKESEILNEKRILSLVDIIENNPHDTDYEIKEKYSFYLKSPTSLISREIRYGKEKAEETRKKLMQRPKIDRRNQRNYDPEYIARIHNISLEEATEKISKTKEKLSSASIKNNRKRKENGYNFRENNPLCLEYWQKREETLNCAKEKHDNYLRKTRTNLEGFSIRHGRENSEKLFNQWVANRRKSFIEKYGVSTPAAGKASKSSMEFFIPLYRKLRRIGFERKDIFWGISGSKEFATRFEGSNYFYDFTIKSIKLIIEYHGSIWHSHPEKEYKGFLNEGDLIKKDLLKKQIMEDRGYTVLYVWDFEDKEIATRRILERIINAGYGKN